MHNPFRLSDFANETLMRFDHIVCLIGDRNYTQIWLRSGRCVVASKNLEMIEQVLPLNFVRIHKQHIVNKSFVVCWECTYQSGLVHLRDGRTLSIARRRLTVIKKILSNLSNT